jgi:hypothetical protein
MGSIAMFLVLFVYKGYHLDRVPAYSGHSVLFRALTHSLITFLIFWILEVMSARVSYFSKSRGKTLSYLFAYLLICLGSFIAFNYFYSWTELYWSSFFPFLYEIPSVLIVPVLIHHFLIVREENASVKLSNISEKLHFTSTNGKERLSILPRDLLYARSCGNYVEIFFKSESQTKKQVLRSTLKKIMSDQSLQKHLIRCHRSFLINPSQISRTEKRKGDLVVYLGEEALPVSTTFEKIILDL